MISNILNCFDVSIPEYFVALSMTILIMSDINNSRKSHIMPLVWGKSSRIELSNADAGRICMCVGGMHVDVDACMTQ
jgi:hypothetical protein